ncbi:hypothetical protein ACO0RG_000924 [Hanseniaspora osmophila]
MKVTIKEEYIVCEKDMVTMPPLIPSLYELEEQQTKQDQQSLDKENTLSVLKLWIKECDKFKKQLVHGGVSDPSKNVSESQSSFQEWYNQEFIKKQPPGLTMSLLDLQKKQ